MVDNIASAAYIICCLMPLLAFIVLAWQTLSHIFCPMPNNLSVQHQDMPHHQGIVSLGNSIEPTTACQPQAPRRLKKISVSSLYRRNKHGKGELNCPFVGARREWEGLLAGCEAGLVEMAALNECYWGKRGGEKEDRCRKEWRVRGKSQKGGFRPTPLAVIIQGLQY